MAYGSVTFDFLLALGDRGLLHPGDRVLELGAQEINTDVSPATVLDFIARFNPDFDAPAVRIIGGFRSRRREKHRLCLPLIQ